MIVDLWCFALVVSFFTWSSFVFTKNISVSQNYNYTHLSAGDLLRAERAREGSEYGQLISSYIKEGKIVPVEITINLLRKVKPCLSNKSQSFYIITKPSNE